MAFKMKGPLFFKSALKHSKTIYGFGGAVNDDEHDAEYGGAGHEHDYDEDDEIPVDEDTLGSEEDARKKEKNSKKVEETKVKPK